MHEPAGRNTWARQGSVQVGNCWAITAQFIRDGRDGCLNVLTVGQEIPFAIKRVFYISDVVGGSSIRGMHAHRVTEQVLHCVSGACTVTLDDGTDKKTIRLSAGPEGIRIGQLVWHTLTDFIPGSVLLVIASEPYDESDYIRDYETFLSLTCQTDATQCSPTEDESGQPRQ